MKTVTAITMIDLLKESFEQKANKIEVVFYPAFEEDVHGKLKNIDLIESLKRAKISIFDITDINDLYDIIYLQKNKKDVNTIRWIPIENENFDHLAN